MTLGDWVRDNGRADAVRRLAAHLNVTVGAVQHWCNGIRQVHPTRCRAIAEFTGGQVPVHETRPDVFGDPNVGYYVPDPELLPPTEDDFRWAKAEIDRLPA